MANYREILRLASLNYSQREMASSLKCSRNTISEVLNQAKAKGIAWPLDADITNAELETFLFPEKRKNQSIYVEPDYAYIHRELAKPGTNLTQLWEEYCLQCHESGRTPYMSTQFGDKYRSGPRLPKPPCASHISPETLWR